MKQSSYSRADKRSASAIRLDWVDAPAAQACPPYTLLRRLDFEQSIHNPQ
ncbi:MAG: hypothetical protein L0I62_05330 [Gammaproteobacteria bacterium]|nr:hypothetical protein [Gammaproteobacteria bacterium]